MTLLEISLISGILVKIRGGTKHEVGLNLNLPISNTSLYTYSIHIAVEMHLKTKHILYSDWNKNF